MAGRNRRRVRLPEVPFPEHGTPINLPETEAQPLLQSGEIIGGYRMPWGSNYTFVVHIDAGEQTYLRAIYKPRDGERPLHDFPDGTLYKREYATFVLSRALGWPNVPPTLIREGPYGVGSAQLYVETDPEITYFDLIEDQTEAFEQIAVFDLLVNNADRKAGHCLLGEDGRVWSIDHGLTFHPIFKLRTVMLEFWGLPISKGLVKDLESLSEDLNKGGQLKTCLTEMLEPVEVRALETRLDAILENPMLPRLDPYQDVPWPFV